MTLQPNQLSVFIAVYGEEPHLRDEPAHSIYWKAMAAFTLGIQLQQAEVERLKSALRLARAWGINSEGFSASISILISDWIDAGMVGDLPELPEWITDNATPGDKT